MASDFVTFQQDPFWGNLASSVSKAVAGAPKAALDQKLTVEQIWALRQKQAQDKAEFDARVKAGEGVASSLAGIGPPSSERDVVYQPEGPANPADIPAPGEDTPLGNAFLPTTTMKEQYIDPKVQERYNRELPMFQGIARAQAHAPGGGNLPSTYARGTVALGGTPSDPNERQRLTFIEGGKFDNTKGDNYVAKDPATGKTLMVLGSSIDGSVRQQDGRKLTDIAPQGSVIVKAGEVGLNEKPRTAFDDEGSRLGALTAAANAIADGRMAPTPAQTRELAVIVNKEFPEITKIMSDAVGNTAKISEIVEKQAPPALRPLLRHIVRTLPEYQPDPAAVAAAREAGVTPPEARLPGTAGMPKTDVLISAPATQAQVNLAGAITRADQARREIERFIWAGADPASGRLPQKPRLPDWKAALLAERGGDSLLIAQAINAMDPEARQYYASAKAWIEPVLRLASGAAIRTEEYRDYMAMFIPNWGDSPKLIADKINRMREWQEATGGNVTANQAVATMIEKARVRGDVEAMRAADRLRVRANEAGRGDIPRDSLPPPSAAAAPSGRVAPAPAPDPTLIDSIKRAVRPGAPGAPGER